MQEHINRAKALLNILDNIGIPAYVVGGFPRDLLMGKSPNDMDVATPLPPSHILERLKKFGVSIDPVTENSSRFGTVFCRLPGFEEAIEITSFRKEVYRDSSRKPETSFGATLQEDASRRDFTINALYIRADGEIIDPTGHGITDARSKTLRPVGSVENRMREDPLRILRAVRFISRGFQPTPELKQLLINKGFTIPLLKTLSIERVREELIKNMERPGISLPHLKNMGVLEWIIPEVKPMYGYNQGVPQHHHWDLFTHSMLTAQRVRDLGGSKLLAFVAFLHDIGKPLAKENHGNYYSHDKIGAEITKGILQSLKFSNKEIRYAVSLVRWHMRLHNPHSTYNLVKTRYMCERVGVPVEDLVILYRADKWASNMTDVPAPHIPPVPKNPVTGDLALKIWEEYQLSDKKLIGKLITKGRDIVFRDPSLADDEVIARVKDYARSLSGV